MDPENLNFHGSISKIFIGFFIDPSIARGFGSRPVRWQSLAQFFFGECFRKSVKADSFLS